VYGPGPPNSPPKNIEIPPSPSKKLTTSDIDARLENLKNRALQRAGLSPASPKSSTSAMKISSKSNVDTAPAFQEFKRSHSASTSPSSLGEDEKPSPPPVIGLEGTKSQIPVATAEEQLESSSSDSEELQGHAAEEEAVEEPPKMEIAPLAQEVALKPKSVISSLQTALEDLSDDQTLSPLKEIPSQPKPSFLRNKSTSSAASAMVMERNLPPPSVASVTSVPPPLAAKDAIPKRVEMAKSQSLMSFGSRQNSAVAQEEELALENITASDIFSRMGSLKEKIRQSSSRNFGGESADVTRARSESNVSAASGAGSVSSTITPGPSFVAKGPLGGSSVASKASRENEDSESASHEVRSVGSASSSMSAMERLKLKLQKSKLEKEGK
jgi:hypothetical protein